MQCILPTSQFGMILVKIQYFHVGKHAFARVCWFGDGRPSVGQHHGNSNFEVMEGFDWMGADVVVGNDETTSGSTHSQYGMMRSSAEVATLLHLTFSKCA